MNVNFEFYKVFYYCAKNLNFSKAAEELFVTQSSVSQTIKKLENQMDVILFHRTGKNISLTKEGDLLFAYIEKAFNIIKLGEQNIESMKSLDKGEIHIGASDTLTKYYLMTGIKKFYTRYPKIKIHLTNRSSPENVKMVHNNAVDFSIININPNLSYKNVMVEKLWTSKNIFVFSPKAYAFNQDSITLEKLNQYPLITLEESSTSMQVMKQYLSEQNIILDFDFEFGTTSLIIEMALAGIGVAYVSRDAVEDLINKKMLQTIGIVENIPSIDIGLVKNTDFPLGLASHKFINLIKSL
jgi:DNA-binding transcriptional LysR family regulator